ncbi:hypothetical protein HGB13_00990 [bacterium]|nr:hypothetical protein [bacterium]
MFSHQDYIDYFSEIERIEIEMIREVHEIQKLVDNKKALLILESIKEDEKRHYQYAREILDLFDS